MKGVAIVTRVYRMIGEESVAEIYVSLCRNYSNEAIINT